MTAIVRSLRKVKGSVGEWPQGAVSMCGSCHLALILGEPGITHAVSS